MRPLLRPRLVALTGIAVAILVAAAWWLDLERRISNGGELEESVEEQQALAALTAPERGAGGAGVAPERALRGEAASVEIARDDASSPPGGVLVRVVDREGRPLEGYPVALVAAGAMETVEEQGEERYEGGAWDRD